MPAPYIQRVANLQTTEQTHWADLQKIEWVDQKGKEHIWEAAAHKPHGGDVHVVAVAAILRHASGAKPPATLIVLQYRPPVDAMCVEFPAGMVDEGETSEKAALRELREETGYEGRVIECSPEIVVDPGFTNVNMQLVTVEVEIKEGDKKPEQLPQIHEGEYIEALVVPLHELHDKLSALAKEGKKVEARLYHWALGLHRSQRLGING